MKVFCFILNCEPPLSIRLVKVVSGSLRIFLSKDLSSFPVNSNEPVCPVDICKSVGPIDDCKAVSLVNICKPFFVDYWRDVSLFFISLFFEISINTSIFNRTTLYMILFINIHMTY